MSKPKILILDIETSPALTATFSLYPESIPYTSIVQDWFIICAAWKELGVKKVDSVAIKEPLDDYAVCQKLGEVISGSDIIVGHFLSSFDYKKINARLMFHGLPPIAPVHQIDTLKEIKKIASFTSNKLDYLTKHLIGQGKQETSSGLWLRAMKGDKKAIKEMLAYNVVDVERTEELYVYIKPYLKSHPHIGAMAGADKNCSCSKCGSTEMRFVKNRFTAAGIAKKQYQCFKCKSYSTFSV